MLRKTITTFIAVAALTVAALTASFATHPSDARAASCIGYGMPSYSVITQGNGWTVTLWKSNGVWYATGASGNQSMRANRVYMSSWGSNPFQPYFEIYWSNGSVGRYFGHAAGATIASIFGNTYTQGNWWTQWNTYSYPRCFVGLRGT
jgi:hypothetical protein